ncbi:hypothetical protein Clacol_010321 [Clathrus columnatus]|uniref:F-box domain-containing protein n=1 Tax=Clathrus columnatus TaxID=1419009 RepID=A0AAV5AQF0_9AGAM|nr:hypothetical protein Clacol_010321 [Clathrus columnatus]
MTRGIPTSSSMFVATTAWQMSKTWKRLMHALFVGLCIRLGPSHAQINPRMTSKGDSTKQFEVIRSTIKNAIDEAIGVHTKVETLSNVHDWGLNSKEERELFEELFDNYAQVITNHLIQLKMRRNQLAAINKLPIEVFRFIISLIDLPTHRVQYSHLSYTWVCRRWRSALIEDPNFWTSVHLRHNSSERVLNPFVNEYLQRSNSAKLNFTLTIKNIQPKLTSKLEEDVIAKNSHRIRNFWLNINQSNLIRPLFLNKDFSSLRALNYTGGSAGFAALLPVLVASDQLGTLQCTLGTNFPINGMNNLKLVLGRIRHLSLDIHTPELFEFVLESIHNSDNLIDLKLIQQDMHDLGGLDPPLQTILPKLLFLLVNNSSVLENFQTPKLSALEVECSIFIQFMEYPIFKEINFSSVEYLYLLDTTNRRGLHSIFGLDECLHSGGSLFTTRPSGFTKDTLLLEDFEAIFHFKDIVSDDECRRDYFNFTFSSDEISDRVLELAFSAILPRLPNLKELYLLSFNLTREVNTPMDGILANIPKVEKLIIQKGGKLKDFILLLTDSFICPRLKHLSYTTMFWPREEDIKQYAEDIGKALVECIQSRYKIHGDVLKFIALGNCPALPDSCLEELKSLGTTVVAEKQ